MKIKYNNNKTTLLLCLKLMWNLFFQPKSFKSNNNLRPYSNPFRMVLQALKSRSRKLASTSWKKLRAKYKRLEKINKKIQKSRLESVQVKTTSKNILRKWINRFQKSVKMNKSSWKNSKDEINGEGVEYPNDFQLIKSNRSKKVWIRTK